MVNRGRGIRYGEGKKVMSLRDFRVLGEECSCKRESASSDALRAAKGRGIQMDRLLGRFWSRGIGKSRKG